MKKRNWIPVTVMALCLLLFAAYWLYSRSIADTTPPAITIDQAEQIPEISVADPQSVLLQGVTARDSEDGDVTASVIVESLGSINENHEITVTYAAFDKSGNVGKAQRTVRYTDYVGPRFALTKPLIYTYGTQFDVLNNVQASDQRDGDIRHRVKTMLMEEEALSEEGIHDVRFRVTNSLGDMEELVLPVEVQYAGRYEAQLYLKEYLVYLPRGTAFVPERYLQEVVYRGTGTPLLYRVPGTMKLEVDGTVDTETPGVYPVAYTLTDAQNGLWSAYTKLIVVVEG